MTLLLAHQLSPELQVKMQSARRIRIAKAELAMIRIQSILGLSDEELICATRRVTALDVTENLSPPPKNR
ncbi:hypothetical protein [Yokenella regensburgei]|uniref:hypothetical protein n=1 Tax=Yokenella regensburgei TaxID=158877 RepID=UPI00056E758D|nr:hypothetical protein [Yokenella regensburgei]